MSRPVLYDLVDAASSLSEGRPDDFVVLTRLWAAPCSLVGLALSLFFRRRYVTRGVIVAEGAAWPRRLGWRFRAITFGHVVLCVDELDPATLKHELVHVRQYERWGPLLFLAYPVASLGILARGGRP
ncbi:MAG: hypothetical protein ACRDLB_07915, partial [Actinomycetota bacterium]